MSLIKCSECGNEVSDLADFCPKCGYSHQVTDDKLKKIISATVQIVATGKDGTKGLGTGFIVGNGRFAVTAYHVVKDALGVEAVSYHIPQASNEPAKIAVNSWTKGACLVGIKHDAPDPLSSDGRILQKFPESGAEIIWSIDISILHLTTSFTNILPLEFDSEYARIGEELIIVGYPNGGVKFKTDFEDFHPLPLTAKATIAFAIKYGIPPVEEFYYWIDRPSFPGNSGGPVLRRKTGKVVGVISATPFMPKRILTPSGYLDVSIPDGYSIAFGTSMLPASLDDAMKSGPWKCN